MGVHIRVWGLTCILLLLLCGIGWGQNPFEKVSSFGIRGYIQSSLNTNSISGIERRQDPYDFRFNGSLLINTLGWTTSLQLNLADGRTIRRLNLPDVSIPSYNLIGVSPQYKWAKFHLGFRSMTFSQYALAGHSFSGVGMELAPGKIRVSAMYGRLRRASNEMLDLRQSLDPQFKRMGWGIKIGYEDGKDKIHAYLFRAEDQLNMNDENNYQTVSPQDNAIIGLLLSKKIGPAFLEVDYAYSALSRDTRVDEIDNYSYSMFQSGFGAFTPNSSTEFRSAFNAKASFETSVGRIHAGIERVDPGYQSLGALFFNNDYENITLGGQLRLQQNIMVSVNTGFQRNNLEGNETNSMDRWVGSINANYNPSDVTSLNFSFSNFRTTNTLYAVSIPFIQVDSIQLSLVNRQFSAGLNTYFNSERNASLTGFLSYFRSFSIQNDVVNPDQKLSNLNAFVAYHRNWDNPDWKFTTSLTLNRNASSLTNVLTFGPTINVFKSVLNDKLHLSSGLSYISIYMDGQQNRSMVNPGISISYEPFLRQELSINSRLVHQSALQHQVQGFSEWHTRFLWKARF
jgi:hypothetical protein